MNFAMSGFCLTKGDLHVVYYLDWIGLLLFHLPPPETKKVLPCSIHLIDTTHCYRFILLL